MGAAGWLSVKGALLCQKQTQQTSQLLNLGGGRMPTSAKGKFSAAGNIASDNGSGLKYWEKSLRACPKY